MRKNYKKFYENFEKFRSHWFNIFLILRNFFRSSLFFQNINFFDTLNNMEDAKKLWEILRK